MITVQTTQADLVAALAAARGLSLGDLDAALGASRGSLSKALRRGALPRLGAVTAAGAIATLTVESVAAALGVPVQVLLGETVGLQAMQAPVPG